MAILFKGLFFIKNTIITLSKIFSILFCFYFLSQYEHYKISFNIPSIIKEYTVFGKFNDFIDYIGVLFLIIPATICIASLLYSEYKKLNIFATFVSMATNIFTVSIGIMHGTLQEFVNMRIVTVYHIESFENKKIAFLTMLKKCVNELPDLSMDKIVKIQQYLDTKFNVVYADKLKSMSMGQIPDYVKNDVIPDILKNINPSSNNVNWPSFTSYFTVSNCVGVIVVALTFFFGYKLYKYFTTEDNVKELANINLNAVDTSRANTELIKDVNEISEKSDDAIGKVISISRALNGRIDNLRKEMNGKIESLGTQNVELNETYTNLAGVVNENGNILEQVINKTNISLPEALDKLRVLGERLDKLENKFQILSQGLQTSANLSVDSILEKQRDFNRHNEELHRETQEKLKDTLEQVRINEENVKNIHTSMHEVQNNAEKELGVMEKKLDEVMPAVEERLNVVIAVEQANRADIERVLPVVKKLKENTDVLYSDSVEISKDVRILEKRTEGLEKVVTELSTTTKGNAESINELQTQVSHDLSKTQGKESSSDSTAISESNVDSIRSGIGQLGKLIRGIKRDNKKLEEKTKEQEARIKQLEDVNKEQSQEIAILKEHQQLMQDDINGVNFTQAQANMFQEAAVTYDVGVDEDMSPYNDNLLRSYRKLVDKSADLYKQDLKEKEKKIDELDMKYQETKLRFDAFEKELEKGPFTIIKDMIYGNANNKRK